MNNNVYDADSGESVWCAIKRIKNTFENADYNIAFLRINDIHLTISRDSNPDDIALIYNLKCRIRNLEG